MKKIAAIALLGLTLQGCSDMPPSCTDDDVKQTLLELVQDSFRGRGSVTVTGHETIEEHNAAKEYTCEARYIRNFNGRSYSEVFTYSVFWADESQDEFYVQLEN